ncbi:MAG: ornithine cyclodeaminase family protein [Sphingomonadales bacterium]|nr:ornithine cyclodeaminase family protein [Sphingomonadales bacterium]
MRIIPEALIADLVSPEDAFSAVEACFAAMARGEAYNFPVVREALGEGRQYGFKSGLDRAGGSLGVKAGGYFPGNAAKGIINHQSTVFLFDPETGQPTAMVGGGLLTALRTAAASALSIDRLARKDARVLGMVGAGHQAGFQLRAAAKVRRFDRVIAWNLHPEMLPKLGEVAAELGLPFEAVPLERMVEADVIVTITSSPATFRSTASSTWRRFQSSRGFTIHRMSSGATIRSPAALPSHQVSQTEPYLSQSEKPPSGLA